MTRELEPKPRFDDVFYKGLENMNREEMPDNKEKALEANWWLKKDCQKCLFYSFDILCPYIERKSKKPRGCSLYRESRSKSLL